MLNVLIINLVSYLEVRGYFERFDAIMYNNCLLSYFMTVRWVLGTRRQTTLLCMRLFRCID